MARKEEEKNLMMAFSSWRSAKTEVLIRNRFFPNEMEKFLELIDLLCKTSTITIHDNITMYRARIYDREYDQKKEESFNGYNKLDSFIPPHEYTIDGRVNPKKIRYLYAAEDAITAIMETRPKLEDLVSVASVKINQPLKIANIVYYKKISTIDECFRFLLTTWAPGDS